MQVKHIAQDSFIRYHGRVAVVVVAVKLQQQHKNDVSRIVNFQVQAKNVTATDFYWC